MSVVNVKVSFASQEWGEHMLARGLAKGTVRTRLNTVEQLVKVVGDIQVSRLDGQHIDRLFTATSWQASTRNVRRSTLSSFFQFCRNRRYMARDRDPLFGWRNVRVPDKTRLRVPVDEWAGLFSACQYPVETVCVGLGLYLMVRASEVRGLRVQDVHLAEGYVDVYRQKTGDRDSMPVCTELHQILADYLAWLAQQAEAQGDTLTPQHYLVPPRITGTMLKHTERKTFIPNTGQLDLSRPHAHPHRIIQTVLARAGYNIDPGEGIHTLRRSGARAYFDELLSQGYDGALRAVQSMLGHKKSAQTETYLGLDVDVKRRDDTLRNKPMFASVAPVVTLPQVRTA